MSRTTRLLAISLLPVLSEAQTRIDGDLGGNCTPDIGIRGDALGPGGPGLQLSGGSHLVQGLAISGFVHDATLQIRSDNNMRASFSAGGDGSFNAPIVLQANPGVLTATATDALGNTSEFSVNLPYGGSDVVGVGSAGGVVAGASTTIPIHVRDLALTPLGVDRPAGERIQGLALRIDFPVAAVANASIAPAGISAALTPAFGPLSNFSPGSVSYLVAYNEGSNPIPFNLDAAAPGDVVAHLQLTVHPGQPPGSFALTLNASTELSNQAGTLAENSANGTLQRVDGSLEAISNAPGGLHAQALSTASIRLRWNDAHQVETGYRVQRSSDGNNYVDVFDAGADDTQYLDSGLAPGTLYYYRVRTLVGTDAGGASNRATASTFPSAPARVCVDAQTINRRWARSPDIAHRGTEWGLVYHARDDGSREQVFFQRLHDLTLAPLAPRVQLSNSASGANFPALAWNGTHYGATWVESLRGAAGGPLASGLRFSLLDGNGNLLRGPRRLDVLQIANIGFNEILRPHWDGSHWGVFLAQFEVPFRRSIAYRRLDADGDSVLGPLDVIASTTQHVSDFEAAWQPLSGEYGMLWVSARDGAWELDFRRLEESSGIVQGAMTVLAPPGTALLVGTSLVADPAGGWLAAWSECDSECAVYTRRVTAGGVAAGPAVRVSGPAPATDARPRLARRSGGWYLYTEAVVSNNVEIYRYLLDASGASDGLPGTAISVLDARASGRPRATSDGSRSLVAWSESPATLEVAGRISEASGTLGTQASFTSGHGPGNTPAVLVPGQPRVVALGGGFVSLWQETSSNPATLHGRLYAADGSLRADYAPLTATSATGRPGLASVGDSWAVAWRMQGGSLRFARYGGDGSVAVPEATLLSGVGQGNLEMGWDGENFALFFPVGSNLRMLRVGFDGTPVGAPVVLGLQGSGVTRVVWLGESWAVLWRDPADGDLLYARVGPDGSLYQPAVEFAPTPAGSDFDISAAFDGNELGVAFAANPGVDPPPNALYFVVVNRDGSQAFPQATLVSAPSGVGSPQLHHDGQRWRVIYAADNENTAGMRELTLERTPGGVTVVASRFLANRSSNTAASAHDGSALMLSWRNPVNHDIHVETDACLADPSPPPCPLLGLSSAGGSVRAVWSSVADPQSGIWRQHLYRDGRMLAELPGNALQFDDFGYEGAAIHAYQVRALNRAFQESTACPNVNFSTTVGDANGNGTLEVADIFYLINFLLANGPAPAGDADANGDGAVSVADIFFIINYFFGGGPLPTFIDEENRHASG